MSAIAEPFLEVTGLHVRYSELVALRDVSLTVVEGEVVCIIGPNGAGKSTLLAAIAGGVAPSRGMIRFRGQNIVDTSPEKIARLGLSLVPEGRHIFGSLTVEENLLIGASRRGDRREIGGATVVGYFRARSLTEGGCVAWVLRLVEIGAQGEGPCADVVEISRPDGLVDIADLGLTLAEAKLVLAGVQREIVAAQARDHAMRRPGCRRSS